MAPLYVTALIAFFSTTIDDFAVLLIFYAKARSLPAPVWKQYLQVILGQFLGFTFVIVLSLSGLLVGTFIPQEYVNAIGIIPLVLGLKKLYELLVEENYISDSCCKFGASHGDYVPIPELEMTDAVGQHHLGNSSNPVSYQDNAIQVQRDGSISSAALNQIHRSFSTSSSSNNELGAGSPSPSARHRLRAAFAVAMATARSSKSTDTPIVVEPPLHVPESMVSEWIGHCTGELTKEVTGYAILCSSDNIGIYIALFASMSLVKVTEIILMLYSLLFVCCGLALLLVQVC